MVLFRLLEKSISIVSTIVLARLLVPEDFGLVAMAMTVVALLDLMRTFGLEMALIQNQDATPRHYNTAWTFNILASTMIAIVLYAVTPIAISFYGEPRLAGIMPFLALGVFVMGFENIGVVLFRKEMNFSKDFIYMLSRKVINFVVAMGLVFYIRDYMALIYAFLIGKVLVLIMSFMIHPYRPRLTLSERKDLFAFSGWLFLNNILMFINQRAPEMIIGRLADAKSLGFYNVSFDISRMTSAGIIQPINRAAIPGFSKLNKDYHALKNSYLNTMGMIALLITPASLGFAIISPVVVPVLLGEKWLDAIPVMQALAVALLVGAIGNNFSIYISLGKPKFVTFIALLRNALLIPTVYFAVTHYGIIGAAWSFLLVSAITTPISYWKVCSILKITFNEIASRYIRPILASVTMCLVLNYLYNNYISLHANHYSVLDLIVLILAGGSAYITAQFALWKIAGSPPGCERQIITVMREKLASKAADNSAS